jgi:hypothetical protein
MKDVVGISASDSCDRPLVAHERVDSPAVGTGEDQVVESRVERFRSQHRQRAVVACTQNPPPGLALSPVLNDQESGAVPPQKAHHPGLGPRFLGRILDRDAPALTEVDEKPRPLEVEDQILRAAGDAGQHPARKGLGGRVECLDCGELQRIGALKRRADKQCVKALRQSLHLRELRHR